MSTGWSKNIRLSGEPNSTFFHLSCGRSASFWVGHFKWSTLKQSITLKILKDELWCILWKCQVLSHSQSILGQAQYLLRGSQFQRRCLWRSDRATIRQRQTGSERTAKSYNSINSCLLATELCNGSGHRSNEGWHIPLEGLGFLPLGYHGPWDSTSGSKIIKAPKHQSHWSTENTLEAKGTQRSAWKGELPPFLHSALQISADHNTTSHYKHGKGMAKASQRCWKRPND